MNEGYSLTLDTSIFFIFYFIFLEKFDTWLCLLFGFTFGFDSVCVWSLTALVGHPVVFKRDELKFMTNHKRHATNLTWRNKQFKWHLYKVDYLCNSLFFINIIIDIKKFLVFIQIIYLFRFFSYCNIHYNMKNAGIFNR